MSASDLIEEREQTHGDWDVHARVTQTIKHTIAFEIRRRAERGQPPLSQGAEEALDMIAHKIGRILAGKWDHQDHWDDIAGYATLVSRSIIRDLRQDTAG